MRHSARGMLAIFLFILIGGPAMADQTPDLGVIKATPNHDFKMSDPSMDFSTVAPESFTWFPHNDDAMADFKDTGAYKTLTRQWIGYDPANRDRFQIEIYGGTIDIANVMDGLAYPSFSEEEWFADMKQVDTNGESTTGGDVLLSKTAADGATDYVRLVSARNGTSVVLIVMRFSGAYFKDYANVIQSLAGSTAFKTPVSPDPAMQGLMTYKVKAPSGQSISFGLPPSWQPRPELSLDDAASSMRFYSREYDSDYEAAIGVAVVEVSELVGDFSEMSEADKAKHMKAFADDAVSYAAENLKMGMKKKIKLIKSSKVSNKSENKSLYNYFFYKIKYSYFSLFEFIDNETLYIKFLIGIKSKDNNNFSKASNAALYLNAIDKK